MKKIKYWLKRLWINLVEPHYVISEDQNRIKRAMVYYKVNGYAAIDEGWILYCPAKLSWFDKIDILFGKEL